MESLFPKKNIVRLAGVLLISSLLVNCSPVAFEAAEVSNSNITPGGPTDPSDPIDPNQTCYIDKFNQPLKPVAKLDILFVTDTSGSLDTERAAVANGIDSFVANLSPDVDYNIAVMLGHGSTSTHTGRLYQVTGEPVVLNKSLGLDTVRTHLQRKLTIVAGDSTSDGGEEGLYSVGRGVNDDSLFATSQAEGFFRNDAALAVVFIADENDICATYPAGVTPVIDPEGKEDRAKALDCANVTPENIYLALKARKGDKPLLVSSIIYTPKKAFPAGGENEIGYGYKEITELSHGLMVDLGGTNAEIAQGLGDIGALANSSLNLITKHLLKQPGTVTEVEVKVDNSTAPFDFDPTIREVRLSSPGSSGSTVEIGYCVR